MFTGNLRSNKEQLNIINVNRNRLNFMHTSILDNILENTRETFTRIIGNSTFYYTIGPKLESENLEKVINNYVDYFNDNFKTFEIIIGTIILTTILTILIMSIIFGKKIFCCKLNKTKKVNYIKSFLPTPTARINMLRRSSDSSIELDIITKRMLRNINNVKQDIVI